MKILIAAATLILLLIVACGGDDATPGHAATVPPSPTGQTPSPTAVPTAAPEPTVTPEPTASPTPVPEPTVTPEPTASPSPAPEPTVTPEPTAAPSPAPEPTAAPTPAATPVPQATPEPPPSVPADIDGDWDGISTIAGLGEIAFTITFTMSSPALQAKMDIPDQSAFGLDLSNVTFQSGRLHYELDSPFGLAVWDGELRDGDGVFEGEFTQAGLQGTFRLQRTDPDAESSQPDEADKTTYSRDEVEFTNGSVTLAGDLTLPDADGPHSAVILISGSGGQDRDSNIYGFKVFEALTDHIVGLNIAVLRFDDRGTGGSSGLWHQATLDDRATDVLAALALLQARDDIDDERIGLVGHSEGGLVALIVAGLTDGIAHLDLLATPAVPGDELLRAQQQKILEVSGADSELVEQARAHQELMLQAVATGEGWSEVEQSARRLARIQIEALPEETRASIVDVEAYIEAAIPQQMESLAGPWFKSFVEYDPRSDIYSLYVPVLALFGVLDTQVPVDQNSTAMSEAFAESNIPSHSLASIWPANHLFQEAETGGIDEYAQLEPEFAPDFLEFLLDWLAMETANP